MSQLLCKTFNKIWRYPSWKNPSYDIDNSYVSFLKPNIWTTSYTQIKTNYNENACTNKQHKNIHHHDERYYVASYLGTRLIVIEHMIPQKILHHVNPLYDFAKFSVDPNAVSLEGMWIEFLSEKDEIFTARYYF